MSLSFSGTARDYKLDPQGHGRSKTRSLESDFAEFRCSSIAARRAKEPLVGRLKQDLPRCQTAAAANHARVNLSTTCTFLCFQISLKNQSQYFWSTAPLPFRRTPELAIPCFERPPGPLATPLRLAMAKDEEKLYGDRAKTIMRKSMECEMKHHVEIQVLIKRAGKKWTRYQSLSWTPPTEAEARTSIPTLRTYSNYIIACNLHHERSLSL
jgi:hypothetical protein